MTDFNFPKINSPKYGTVVAWYEQKADRIERQLGGVNGPVVSNTVPVIWSINGREMTKQVAVDQLYDASASHLVLQQTTNDPIVLLKTRSGEWNDLKPFSRFAGYSEARPAFQELNKAGITIVGAYSLFAGDDVMKSIRVNYVLMHDRNSAQAYLLEVGVESSYSKEDHSDVKNPAMKEAFVQLLEYHHKLHENDV